MAVTRSTIWIDAQGRTQQTIFTTSAGGGTIETDMAALSNAAVLNSWEGAPAGPSGATTIGTYQTVRDYVLVQYINADLTVSTLSIPAPLIGIFLSDGVTLDTANAGVLTLTGAVIGSLLGASGSPATAILGGTRRSRNRAYP
jgi:hypothetical protein